MKTEVIDSTYENGKRIVTQKVTYEKSDDLFVLANLQKQYENVCRRIEENSENSDISHWMSEKARLEDELSSQQEIIDNYEKEE